MNVTEKEKLKRAEKKVSNLRRKEKMAMLVRLSKLNETVAKGKKLTVVLNGAAEDDDREFALLRDLFKEMADYLKLDFTFLGVGTTDDAAFEKAMEKVKNL